ncbi:DUF1858 domain-containing protein [Lacticaseibacillus mingshuiensis]|uniref:DUF1858 domain-containing protein n=1 Tax=Lacticaseibacillus mingshuiensis TaxID=2799574 RepID=A0ABW4CFB4_9LACO|nr:DUF1858 domain-containing protein [Lacticaseibacillus mingshuiensis]
MTKISLQTPVRELVQVHPEVVPVMVKMGLSGVTDPALLNTVGRFMTLEKGARMKHIALADLLTALTATGFEVENND